ncbi:hypothetical protein PoB_001586300 [Plakobranchus ocellatus]|uniref:Uncharacterized protein n=1 Tax=Plakobranchus ocellatus TaxID=259542 RepID=A0AAV3Z3N7_9GAST|nr:hypothetical protein PoB_001586300 [Plakobranchus ocellatus]
MYFAAMLADVPYCKLWVTQAAYVTHLVISSLIRWCTLYAWFDSLVWCLYIATPQQGDLRLSGPPSGQALVAGWFDEVREPGVNHRKFPTHELWWHSG